MNILIYGANGFTGKLIVDQTDGMDFDPILAGRSSEIEDIAGSYSYDYRIFSLANPKTIRDRLSDVDLVLHCAGPFTITGKPMIDACLDTKTHYLDITGEIEIFEYCREQSERAQEAGILLLPGCGFDIIPTDNLSTMLYEQNPSATHLEVAIYGLGKPSKGTSRSIVKILADGGRIVENGTLKSVSHGSITRDFQFYNGKKRTCIAVPLPDLISTYEATKIPNIAIYYSIKPSQVRMIKFFRPLIWMLKFPIFASIARSLMDWLVSNPESELRSVSPSFITAELKGPDGTESAELKTPNAYDLTADAVVKAISQIKKMDEVPTGFHSPSEVLGSDFILSCHNVDMLHTS